MPQFLELPNKHEIFHLYPKQGVDIKTKSVQFTVHGQYYDIQLWRYDELTSQIEYIGIDVPESITKRKPCHWYGQVVNAKQSQVAFSMCPGNGISARINAFGETLFLHPTSKYFENTSYADNAVIAFRTSDNPVEHDQLLKSIHSNMHDQMNNRRKLGKKGVWWQGSGSKSGSKSGSDEPWTGPVVFGQEKDRQGFIEMFVVIDPVLTDRFKAEDNNWENKIIDEILDDYNQVSSIYSGTNWGTRGPEQSLFVRLKYIQIVEDWTNYPQPQHENPQECSSGEFNGERGCRINDLYYIYTLVTWAHFKDWSKFDALQVLSGMFFSDDRTGFTVGGIAFRGTICNRDRKAIGMITYASPTATEKWRIGALSHELGHNLGFEHDGQEGTSQDCDPNEGLMGYGRNYKNFSSCSVSFFEQVADDALRCLTHGWDKPGSKSYSPDSVDSGEPVLDPLAQGYPCIEISNFNQKVDGMYYRMDDTIHDGVAVYEMQTPNTAGTPLYIFYGTLSWGTNLYRWWWISPVIGDYYTTQPLAIGWCWSLDITQCPGESWSDVVNSTYAIQRIGAVIKQCGQLSSDDMLCLNNYDVPKVVHIENDQEQDSLPWIGRATFKMMNEVCKDNKVAYVFVQNNNATKSATNETVQPATWFEAAAEQDDHVYYLYYSEEPHYFDSSLTWNRWIISKQLYSDADMLAYCEEDNVCDCTYGTWNMEMVSDDGIYVGIQDAISVDDNECVIYDATLENNDKNGALMWAIASVLIVTGVILLVIGGWLIARRLLGHSLGKKHLQYLEDDEVDDDAEDEDDVKENDGENEQDEEGETAEMTTA